MNDDFIDDGEESDEDEERKQCPSCGSTEFVTMPNRYDILTFKDDFEVSKSYYIDEFNVQCRECAEDIDVEKSSNLKRIVLKSN